MKRTKIIKKRKLTIIKDKDATCGQMPIIKAITQYQKFA